MQRSLRFVSASVLVLGLLVVPAFADALASDRDATESRAKETAPEYTEVSFNGMTIAIDPETGHLRPPTARETRKLQRQMRRMFRQVKRHNKSAAAADAATGDPMSRVLGQDHLNFEILHLDADGNHRGQCVNGAEAASKALGTSVDLAPAREEM